MLIYFQDQEELVKPVPLKFLQSLNCINGPTPEPCNVCANCERINNGTSMDVLEIDLASNRGIDEIRELRETVKFALVDGRYKVYIIDEVHMLTTKAFNALLKTLEEPPPHGIYFSGDGLTSSTYYDSFPLSTL